jgi:hypothetical protein
LISIYSFLHCGFYGTGSLQYQYKEARKTLFFFVIPGNEMPEWFDHQTVAPSVSIHLHPSWWSKKFLGFVLCSVFAVHERCQLPPVYPYEYHITCIVKVDGEELHFIYACLQL